MIYLQPRYVKDMYPSHWGLMITPKGSVKQALLADFPWAADNQAFTTKFNPERFFTWLMKLRVYQPTNLFVTVPDRLFDAEGTLALYRKYAYRIRNMGFKTALVAQNGLENKKHWPEFDTLFIGGSTDWKKEPAGGLFCCRRAKDMGKWVHVGRLNGESAVKRFILAGADSCDGTNIVFAPDKNWPGMQHWPLQMPLMPDPPLKKKRP
jgi:hypothetical protein